MRLVRCGGCLNASLLNPRFLLLPNEILSSTALINFPGRYGNLVVNESLSHNVGFGTGDDALAQKPTRYVGYGVLSLECAVFVKLCAGLAKS